MKPQSDRIVTSLQMARGCRRQEHLRDEARRAPGFPPTLPGMAGRQGLPAPRNRDEAAASFLFPIRSTGGRPLRDGRAEACLQPSQPGMHGRVPFQPLCAVKCHPRQRPGRPWRLLGTGFRLLPESLRIRSAALLAPDMGRAMQAGNAAGRPRPFKRHAGCSAARPPVTRGSRWHVGSGPAMLARQPKAGHENCIAAMPRPLKS